MKYYQSLSVFKFPWDQVSQAVWIRYPNPYSSHVLSEDTIYREVQNGSLVSKRLLTKTNKMPRWGERIVMGPRHVCVVEESIVDPSTRTLTTYTRNIGYTKLMTAEEKCVYTVSEENGQWTQLNREVWICSNIFGLSRPIQAFGLERFKKNAMKSFQGFEHVLNNNFIPDVTAGGNSAKDINISKVNKKEQLKHTAKQAKERAAELAKSKAEQVVASVGKTA